MRRSIVPMLILISACDASRRREAVPEPAPVVAGGDTSFEAMQQRGTQAMGFDQLTSRHQFAPTADGGTITIERDIHDDLSITQIRLHLLRIARAFGRGDFDLPGFIHQQKVPGTDVMAEKRRQITYTVEDTPHGGILHMQTPDPEALRAIHSFLAFQTAAHRTAH